MNGTSRIQTLVALCAILPFTGAMASAATITGRVYEGPTGVETDPISDVTVTLYGAQDPCEFQGSFIVRDTTDADGLYVLETGGTPPAFDFFNIIQTNLTTPQVTYVDSDPPGATTAIDGGTVKSPNWIQYGYGDIFVFGKTLTGNKFWDRLPNRPPVANPDSATTMRDTAVTIFVLANDSDPDNDPLTITSVTSPPHGTATHNGQRVTYTPQSGWTGSDSFSYTISDGRGGTATARVSVTVNPPANRPPEARDDFYSVQAGQTLMVAAIGMLGNDTDPDGDTLTANIDAHAKSPHG